MSGVDKLKTRIKELENDIQNLLNIMCEDCKRELYAAPECGYCNDTGYIIDGHEEFNCPECSKDAKAKDDERE